MIFTHGRFHIAATKKPLSPAVRSLLGQHGLSAESIPATGPKGHLLKGCVQRDPDFNHRWLIGPFLILASLAPLLEFQRRSSLYQ
jgi:hypothetical protein